MLGQALRTVDRPEYSLFLSADRLLFSYYCTIARRNYLIPINRYISPTQALWFRWFSQSRKRTLRFCNLFIRRQVTVFLLPVSAILNASGHHTAMLNVQYHTGRFESHNGIVSPLSDHWNRCSDGNRVNCRIWRHEY